MILLQIYVSVQSAIIKIVDLKHVCHVIIHVTHVHQLLIVSHAHLSHIVY